MTDGEQQKIGFDRDGSSPFGPANGSGSRLLFRTIVADPPWRYGRDWDGSSGRGCRGLVLGGLAVPMPYEQMKLKEIMALPVGALADENCDLYLWTTQKYLPHAFDVLDAWGFRYCQTLTWCKTPRGTGQGGLYCPTTEFLLVARRGKMPDKTRVDTTWWNITRPHNAHSAKPEFFTDLIESMSDAPRLELFARRNRLGWATWGDEALNHVNLVTQND